MEQLVDQQRASFRGAGKSALEVIMTTLHSGGKFSNKAYETAGGLHGVGISVVNALSEQVEVEVARDRKLYYQRFSRGTVETPLEFRGPTANRRGTTVRFKPDIASDHNVELLLMKHPLI